MKKAEENMTTLNLTQEWDKVFPLSEKVGIKGTGRLIL